MQVYRSARCGPTSWIQRKIDMNQPNETQHPHGHDAAAHAARPVYDDINVPVVVMVGMVSAIVTYLIIELVYGITNQMTAEMIQKQSYDVQYVKSVDAIENQKLGLAANDKGRISIEQAMQETLAKYAKEQTH